jgi:CheY-like chemotaxis protein
MPLKVFVLEDEIDRLPRCAIISALVGHEVDVAKNVPEAKEVYKGGYDILLLDHDMEGFYEDSEHPNTGYQFVKWLVDGLGRIDGATRPYIVIHSHNNYGRANMRKLLEDYGFEVDEFPFNSQYIGELKRVLKARS